MRATGCRVSLTKTLATVATSSLCQSHRLSSLRSQILSLVCPSARDFLHPPVTRLARMTMTLALSEPAQTASERARRFSLHFTPNLLCLLAVSLADSTLSSSSPSPLIRCIYACTRTYAFLSLYLRSPAAAAFACIHAFIHSSLTHILHRERRE